MPCAPPKVAKKKTSLQSKHSHFSVETNVEFIDEVIAAFIAFNKEGEAPPDTSENQKFST